MKAVVFQKTNGGKLEISEGVLEHLPRFVQLAADAPESGGLLLGRHIISSTDIVVDDITTPMPKDQQNRHSYRRLDPGHQELADRAWQDSGHTCVYIGEWHSHPEPTPTPSIVDRRDWRRKTMMDQYNGDALYFLLIGTKCLRVWEIRRTSNSITLIGDFEYMGGSDGQ